MFSLSEELMNLRNLKDDLEQQLTEVATKINSVEFRLCETMTENNTQNFTRNGQMFYLTTRTRASVAADMKDDLYVALKAQGYGDLIKEQVNANSLNSFVNEQISQNDEMLPQWLNGLVSIFEKATVAVRKVPNK